MLHDRRTTYAVQAKDNVLHTSSSTKGNVTSKLSPVYPPPGQLLIDYQKIFGVGNVLLK